MGMDDDRDCAEHVWRVVGLDLADEGAALEKECERCGAVLLVGSEELGGRVG